MESSEDKIDIQLADAAKKDIEKHGTVSWKDLKEELNLCSTKSNSPQKHKKTLEKSPENS